MGKTQPSIDKKDNNGVLIAVHRNLCASDIIPYLKIQIQPNVVQPKKSIVFPRMTQQFCHFYVNCYLLYNLFRFVHFYHISQVINYYS